MASGKDLFQGPNTYTLRVNGEMNGKKFLVTGRGDKPKNGKFEITCVSENGDLPFSWAVLTQTIGYGFHMLAKYPEDIVDFFKDCFPEGMTMTRTAQFDDGGVINTTHKYTFDHGNLHSETTFKGEGFDAKGDVMQKNLMKSEPVVMYVSPHGQNSVKERYQNHFLTIDGRYITSVTESTCTSAKPKQRLPVYHLVKVLCNHSKNVHVAKDHIIQSELVVATKFELDESSLE